MTGFRWRIAAPAVWNTRSPSASTSSLSAPWKPSTMRPGADPGRIVLGFQGADKLEVDADGDLVFHTAGAAIRQRKPVIYQEVDGLRRDIAGGYVLRETRTVGFK